MSPHGGQLRKPLAMITDSVTSPWSSPITPRSEFFLLRWSHSPTPGHHLKLDNTIPVHGSSQEWLSCHLSRDASTTSVMAFLVLQGIRDCKRCSRKEKTKLLLHCCDQTPNMEQLNEGRVWLTCSLGIQFITRERHGERSSRQLWQPKLELFASNPMDRKLR